MTGLVVGTRTRAPLVVGTAVPLGPGRRILDVVVAVTGLVVLTPLLLLLALAIRVTGRGPVLYRQVRVGAGGRPFTIYKFRSMRWDAGGSAVTPSGDPRVTRVGRWMRAVGLDELPQLVNVLWGDMTLVGPRPEVYELAVQYPDWAREVFRHRPGITGPGQLRIRDEDVLASDVVGSDDDLEHRYLTSVVPRRCALDLAYLARPTLASTVRLLGETALYLARRSLRPLHGIAHRWHDRRRGRTTVTR